MKSLTHKQLTIDLMLCIEENSVLDIQQMFPIGYLLNAIEYSESAKTISNYIFVGHTSLKD